MTRMLTVCGIEVTPVMLKAGAAELAGVGLGDDLARVAGQVFVAMALTSADRSAMMLDYVEVSQ